MTRSHFEVSVDQHGVRVGPAVAGGLLKVAQHGGDELVVHGSLSSAHGRNKQ